MSLFLWGISHNIAKLDLRELVVDAATHPHIYPALRTALYEETGKEASFVIIATCNRVEVYLESTISGADLSRILHRVLGAGLDEKYFFKREGLEAVQHLFAMVSGLESMVLGEAHITGQVKKSFLEASEKGFLSSLLHKLFQHAFAVSKKLRSLSDIGSGTVSFAAASLLLVKRTYPDLSKARVLLLGAGEMIHTVLKYFLAQQPASLVVSNRSQENAHKMVAQSTDKKIKVIPWDKVDNVLSNFDVVVICTASGEVLLSYQQIKAALALRQQQEMVFIDLALPRNIDVKAGSLAGAHVFSIDDIGAVTDSGKDKRMEAFRQVQYMLQKEVINWQHYMEAHLNSKENKAFIQHANGMVDEEVNKALKHLSRGASVEEAMQFLAHRINAKWLDGYLVAKRQSNKNSSYQDWFFGTNEEDNPQEVLDFFLQKRRGQ